MICYKREWSGRVTRFSFFVCVRLEEETFFWSPLITNHFVGGVRRVLLLCF